MNNPIFTRRHYEKIADVISKVKMEKEIDDDIDLYTLNVIVQNLSYTFEKDNDRFKRDLFIDRSLNLK